MENQNIVKGFYIILQHVKIYTQIQMMIAKMKELKNIKLEDIIQSI